LGKYRGHAKSGTGTKLHKLIHALKIRKNKRKHPAGTCVFR
jgi:hypothetical protein